MPISQIADFVDQVKKPPVLDIEFANTHREAVFPFLLRSPL
jgi:hypothetical protein